MSKEIAKKFYTSGAVTTLVTYSADALNDSLEAGIYELRASKMGYYLVRQCDKYDLPKLYGNVVKRASKIMNTFNDRDASTGVLLSGDKGTGKSLLSMVLANIAVSEGRAIININEAFYGSDFEELMNAIPDAVLVFDEFGKKYRTPKDSNDDPQEHLLGFFDGAGARKRLMIFTENKTSGINEFMLNRPGRIFYHYKYTKLASDVIAEYCEEMGVKEESTTFLQNYAINAREFSFDILKAIVEELLRYSADDVQELISELNITSGDTSKTIQVVSAVDADGKPLEIYGKDQGLYSYHNDFYFTVVPKDATKRAEKLTSAQKSYDEYIAENPEEINAVDISDWLDRKRISSSTRVLTTKDGVTYVKDSDGHIFGYKEVEKVLPNYMGYMGAY